MSGWIPPRLRGLIGQDLDDVTPGSLENLVGIAEDTDLEFKAAEYETTEGQAKEACYDVAGIANAGGGLLVIGMAEDGAGVATALAPVDSSHNDFGLWIHQVLASRVSPPVDVTHRSLAFGGDVVHLLGIGPSIYVPHSVAVGDGGMRFPIRTGTTRRWLSQVEAADLYRRRFEAFEDRSLALDRIHGTAVDTVPGDERREPWAWLILSLVPDFPGGLELRQGLVTEWRDFINQALREFPAYQRWDVDVSLGFLSLTVHDVYDPDAPIRQIGGRLQLDGSGLLLFGYVGGRNMIGARDDVVPIYDEHLLGDIVNGIRILATHSVRSGSSGNGQVRAELVSSSLPMVLAQYRSRFPGELDGTKRVAETTGSTSRTIPLAASSVQSSDLLGAARMMVTDLGSAFGQPEPQQVTADLQLRRSRFQRDWQPQLERWAEHAGVAITE